MLADCKAFQQGLGMCKSSQVLDADGWDAPNGRAPLHMVTALAEPNSPYSLSLTSVESFKLSLKLNLAPWAAAASSAALLLFIGTDVTSRASVRIQVAQVRPRPGLECLGFPSSFRRSAPRRWPSTEGEIRPLEARPTSTVCQKLRMEDGAKTSARGQAAQSRMDDDQDLLLLPPQPHAATTNERARNG